MEVLEFCTLIRFLFLGSDYSYFYLEKENMFCSRVYSKVGLRVDTP